MKLELSWVRNLFSSQPKVVQKSLHPFFETPFDLMQPQASIERRALELGKWVGQIFETMGAKNNISVICHNNFCEPFADNQGIFISKFYLVSPEEYPAHLRLKDPNDPKVDDPKFVKELANLWFSADTLIKVEINCFRTYLRLMQNPEMAKRGFNFALHHELAHIFHHHLDKTPNYSTNRIKLFLIALLIWVYEPIGKFFDKIIDTPTKRMEGEADRTALMITKDVEGAAYFFQVSQAADRQCRNELSWKNKLFITPSGDYIPEIFTHQLTSNRIASFKTALAQ